MLIESVLTFEKMDCIYNPDDWKKEASWAPMENIKEVAGYLNKLGERAGQNCLF